MKLKINGEEKSINGEITVSNLLSLLNIDSSKIVVEVNLSIIDKNEYNNFSLKNGDVLEIIRFMGGG